MPISQISAPSSVIAAAHQRVWGSARAKLIGLYIFVFLFCSLGQILPQPDQSVFLSAEQNAFDIQMRLLRFIAPTSIENDLVLIGMDDASILAFPEPIALWHKHLGKTLQALAAAKPRAVGVDAVLPERSFDEIMPGLDLALFRGIKEIAVQKIPLVFVRTVDSELRQVPVHLTYERLLGEKGIGIDQQLNDSDSVSRRFSEAKLGGVATFAGQLLRALNVPVGEGYIDYSIGDQLDYIPMQDVIGWLESGNEIELKRRFGNRVVLIGSVWKHMDRWMLPVKITAWEKLEGNRRLSQPGVIVHLQVLRSQLTTGLITPLPEWFTWLAIFCAATAVFIRSNHSMVLIGGIALPPALVALSVTLIRTQQILIPLATVVLVIWLALIARAVLDAIDSAAERIRIKRSFSGQVSPAVMKEILGGRLEPGSSARLFEVCVIFSDIRGFTTLSESMPPETVMNVLQRYFDRMVKVVHRFDGTIDKFIGDGMMILFGAPRLLADPCSDAVQCALAMLGELDGLNKEFVNEGLPILVVGIGINYGKVVVGNIGSTERHNYSAIGDAVNVAARVEGLTKDVNRKILITESVVSRIGDRFNFEPLGERLVKGHSPVKVWGIRVARAAGATNGGTEKPAAVA